MDDANKENITYKRMQFKGNKVWLAVDPEGAPVVKDGKHLIKYQLDQDHEYWVHKNSVKSLDSKTAEPKKAKEKPPRKVQASKKGKTSSKNTVHVYTDGACSGNPGPAGIGVVLKYGDKEKKISRNIGMGTNNIAELEAIKAGLTEIKNPDLPVKVYTDSSYAMGLLTLGWKPKKNTALVLSIKNLITNFKDIEFIKVKGHSGHTENEMADQLAVSAISKKDKI